MSLKIFRNEITHLPTCMCLYSYFLAFLSIIMYKSSLKSILRRRLLKSLKGYFLGRLLVKIVIIKTLYDNVVKNRVDLYLE